MEKLKETITLAIRYRRQVTVKALVLFALMLAVTCLGAFGIIPTWVAGMILGAMFYNFLKKLYLHYQVSIKINNINSKLKELTGGNSI